jgi:hypothetical protein
MGTLLDELLALGEDELDVAGVGHVGVDLRNQLVFLCYRSVVFGFQGMKRKGNIHDRGHGRSFCDPWGPG